MKARIRDNNYVHSQSYVGETLEVYKKIDTYIENANTHTTCISRCVECCYHYFYISMKEFYTIVHYCLTKMPPKYLDSRAVAAHQQMQKFKLRHPEEYSKINNNFNEKPLEVAIESFFEDHEYIQEPLDEPCIFLNPATSRCDIYPVRPAICRFYGSVCSENPLLQPKCIRTFSQAYPTMSNLDALDTTRLDKINGKVTRPYPIIDLFSSMLPRVLNNPQKLALSWTKPQ